MDNAERIDVDKPLWDQNTYIGRWKHFAFITDCRTLFASESQLTEANQLLEDYKIGSEPPGTTRKDIIRAKKLRDSAFHPDNGQLMNAVGRMSAQLPASIAITTAMLTFYKSAVAVLGCQLMNQAFNAFVNYTNRNAMTDDVEDTAAVSQAFACATIASCAAALGFRRRFSGRGKLGERLVPFCAVAVGNMVNLPIMRQREIVRGNAVFAEETQETCIMRSKVAAVKGISECVISRITMAAPGMILIPIVSQKIKPYCFYQLRPWIRFPIEIMLCTASLLIMIPSALAIFPQTNSMKPKLMKWFLPEYKEFQAIYQDKEWPSKLYYNKGL